MRLPLVLAYVLVMALTGCIEYRAGDLCDVRVNELEKAPWSTCCYFSGRGVGPNMAQSLGAFGVCKWDAAKKHQELKPGEIRIATSSNMLSVEKGICSSPVVTGLSLCLLPLRMEFRFEYHFTVTDWRGKTASYAFADSKVSWSGPLVVFAMPFYESIEFEELYRDVQTAALGHLAIAMRRDGFFVAPERIGSGATKTNVNDASHRTVAARRKELEDLKKAGIIDEAEYAAEVKKLEGAGK